MLRQSPRCCSVMKMRKLGLSSTYPTSMWPAACEVGVRPRGAVLQSGCRCQVRADSEPCAEAKILECSQSAARVEQSGFGAGFFQEGNEHSVQLASYVWMLADDILRLLRVVGQIV